MVSDEICYVSVMERTHVGFWLFLLEDLEKEGVLGGCV